MDVSKLIKEAENIHFKKKDIVGAINVYKQIIEIEPNSSAANAARANLNKIAAKQMYENAYNQHYKAKNLEGAKKLYKDLIEKHSESEEAGYAESQLNNLTNEDKKAEAAEELKSEQEKYLEELERKGGKEINLTTAQHLEGYQVTKTIDIITAECVFGMNFLRDYFTSVRDFWGGRSGSSQKVLKDARRICLAELRKEAMALGADAVIAVSLAYSEFSGKDKSMLFLIASGTAVNIEKNPN